MLHVAKQHVLEISDETSESRRAERDRVSEHDPDHCDDADGKKALDENGERVLAMDESTVEERHARGHQQDERGTDQDPARVAVGEHARVVAEDESHQPLALVLDRFHRGGDGVRVSQESSVDRLSALVDVVHDRNPGGEVQADDLLIGDPVEMLDERSQRVAVGDHEDPLAVGDLRLDHVVPVGERSLDGVGECFGAGQFIRGHVGVALIVSRPVWITSVHRRRRRVVASSPDQDLLGPVLLDGLGLVQSLERAIVAFVESPTSLDGKPHAIEFIQGDPHRPDRPLQERGVHDVEVELVFGQETAG